MSSRANKMEKQALVQSMPKQETKDVNIRIDVFVEGKGKLSTYMLITGVPKDLPAEYEGTVIKAAEGQFAQAINARLFLEFYSLGKTSKDEQPVFINLSKVNEIKVIDIKKID